MTDIAFAGFPVPKENWTKMPHELIDMLPLFKGKAELVVVLYILRHTWGFQEFDKPKRISLDEFEKGRKQKDGERMDSGCGLTRSSILRGLKLAEQHGFIEIIVDKSDEARVKKFYAPRMGGSKKYTPPQAEEEVQKVYPRGIKTIPRTKKDTIRKKEERNTNAPDGAATPQVQPFIDRLREKKVNLGATIKEFGELVIGEPFVKPKPRGQPDRPDYGPASRLLKAAGSGRSGAERALLALAEAYDRVESRTQENIIDYAHNVAEGKNNNDGNPDDVKRRTVAHPDEVKNG